MSSSQYVLACVCVYIHVRTCTEDEDYGDYVTRCICDLVHDDGYMIACDECGVWQHIECMQVDPKNLPDNYLCERCEPRYRKRKRPNYRTSLGLGRPLYNTNCTYCRSIDRRRARQIQLKKREALSELEESRTRRGVEGKSSSKPLLPPVPINKKKRKKGKVCNMTLELT